MATRKANPVERQSVDLVKENIARLKELFPEAVSEGKVDFGKLRATLGEIVDDKPERYSFTWAGKRDAIRLLQVPSRATLKPCPEESVNWETTKNLFIEGENLEVLKLLYKSYAGRVKMIYIDPPYNTGKDFIYSDDYHDPLGEYLRLTGQRDDEGNLLTSKVDRSGRYHSAWLSMMYPRLFVARQLLGDDGVIFVSINDGEVLHVRLMLNEVFGEENYLATFVWVNEGNIDNQSRIKTNHEYVVLYAKDESRFPAPPVIDPNIPPDSKLFKKCIENTIVKNGPGNPVTAVKLPVGFPAGFQEGTIEPNADDTFWPKLDYSVRVSDFKTQNEVTVKSGWSSRHIFEQFIANGFRTVTDTKGQESSFYISETGAIIVKKERLEGQSHVLTVLRGLGTVQIETAKLKDWGLDYDYPKPTELLKYLIRVGSDPDALVLDFFAGSCPLAEAIISLNGENPANQRRFMVVQLPEPIPSHSGLRSSGFDTIAEIAETRIQKAISALKAQTADSLDFEDANRSQDIGFRVFTLTESSYRQWHGSEEKDGQKYTDEMALFTDPLLPGWKPEDVIWEVALKEGYGLSATIEPLQEIKSNQVFRVTDPDREQSFCICLDDKLSDEMAKTLMLGKEDLFVCRDAALTDEQAANLALQCKLKTI
ncbi:MAG: hypothetical protein A2Y76_04205 [Planctomycetes bacterium RBG_13_60_9]|nr:MAG: hypothetical protein A2Y76_04205 [Planctomycetes bacterium RBG_13_60_9]